MRTIRIIEHISLDGVIQAPGGPNEDGDYPYGGWAAPFHDPAAGEAIVAAQGKGFDLLLGRRTYDIFAGYWPHQSGPMADNLNAATKYSNSSSRESRVGPGSGSRTGCRRGHSPRQGGRRPQLDRLGQLDAHAAADRTLRPC